MIENKTILIGITGGIAAYKICDLIRMFKKKGANVKVVATQNALNFVTKLTLQTLSQNSVAVEQFDVEEYKPEHICLADEADIFVIAPVSANTISKLATGICDNLLTSIACAFKKPLILAPAMNCNMWENPVIQENLGKLKSIGYEILEPEEGFLACGYNGNGRLCAIDKIYDKTVEILNIKKKLSNKKIVITAGGTREKIDTVRFISNYSSGKMGFALAEEACKMGAEVVLIATATAPSPQPSPRSGEGEFHVITINSALEMQQAVEQEFKNADVLIMAAAVADYRAKETADFKLKKTSQDEISIQLVKNPDILKEISAKKRDEQIVIGFCAESENLLTNAKEKIQKKDCDFLIANDISRSDIGFSSDFNEVYILDKSGNTEKIERASKHEIAKKILEKII